MVTAQAEYVGVGQFARLMGMHKQSVYSRIAAGAIEVERVDDRLLLIRRERAIAYMAEEAAKHEQALEALRAGIAELRT